ncbi:anthrone oxygenase family protein [Flavobacterium sp.]|uniref:anthrone oxygenase family protein n=1 Tax=Flavobacterium sp. TaxID=239 RepID=UPI004034745F
MSFANITLFLAALCTALMAGLFYSYSCSVNPGLAKLPDSQYLSAMQHINSAIQNPAFFAAFFGALMLLPLCAYLSYASPAGLRFWLLVTATVIYAVGLFGVTAFGNVPLNEMLDRFDVASATQPDIAIMRQKFEVPWNRWHFVRTIAVLLSLGSVLAACIVPAKRMVIE